MTTTKNSFPIFVIMLLAFLILSPLFSFANGGDQRIVDGKYMINLSRVPFTPRAGDKTQMLASFIDLKTNKFVSEDMIVKIRISKFGDVSGKREFIYEQDNVKVTEGVLAFSHTFKDRGLHEIFFDFAFASNPKKVYEAPDFLLDIQQSETPWKLSPGVFLGIVIGAALGFIGGWLIRKHIK